ncbi:MAG TPA: META domain-containing protein [Chitinophagaceae bacterium]|nr:META domain-containing protein [Chitinophagaceae bacterium]
MKSIFKFSLLCFVITVYTNCNQTKKTSTTENSMAESKKTNASLTETYWKLTELMGKPVAMTPADKKEIHITLRKEGKRIEGFGGCNGFGGTYETKNNFNISFSSMIGTMIACPELDTENALFNVLKTVDNYYVIGDTLSLSKAKMATMARLVAVYLK